MNLRGLISYAIIFFSFASCNKEEGVVATPNNSEVTFTSGIATRASGQKWAHGDEIGVFMSRNGTLLNGNVKYTTTSTSENATFESETSIIYPPTGAVDFLAYYPWNDATTDINNYDVDVTTQTYLHEIDLMIATKTGVAQSSNEVALNFEHKLSKIVVNVIPGHLLNDSDLVGLKVELIGAKAKANYNLTNDKIDFGSVTTTPITLQTVTDGKTYGGIVIPQSRTSGSLKLRFTTQNGTTFETPLSIAKFEGNKQYEYSTTISRTEVILNGTTISAWGDDSNPNDNNIVAVRIPPKVGDCYYKDKTWSSTYTADVNNPVIGLVFYIDPLKPFNGKIVSLDQSRLGFTKPHWSITGLGKDSGLANMKIWEDKDNNQNYYALLWAHNKNTGTPNYATGQKGVWYLPAVYELQQLYAGISGVSWGASPEEISVWDYNENLPGYESYATVRSEFNKKLEAAGGTKMDLIVGEWREYLSSSNKALDHSYVLRVNFGNSRYYAEHPNNSGRIRAIRAF